MLSLDQGKLGDKESLNYGQKKLQHYVKKLSKVIMYILLNPSITFPCMLYIFYVIQKLTDSKNKNP
jgi:hypothetical protein